MAKVAVPRTATAVIDRAIQVHSGAGLTDDTPLSRMYAWHRAMRPAQRRPGEIAAHRVDNDIDAVRETAAQLGTQIERLGGAIQDDGWRRRMRRAAQEAGAAARSEGGKVPAAEDRVTGSDVGQQLPRERPLVHLGWTVCDGHDLRVDHHRGEGISLEIPSAPCRCIARCTTSW
jgi:hypothetical protein